MDTKAEPKAEPKADYHGSGFRAQGFGAEGQAIDHRSGSEPKASEPKSESGGEVEPPTTRPPAAKSSTNEQGRAGSQGSSAQGHAGANVDRGRGQQAPAAGGSVNLTTEQKTKIRTTVLQSSSAPKVSRSQINFNISVGTVVPRSVHFVTVPATLVEIHPAWRGYSYFIVDDEIIIVEPRTLKIVAVLTV